ncbi:MAG: competence protein ComEC family protein [Bacteroides sp.]|nr:competence protein ComEC family protein [Eubacterium sp.]MCM1417420.1 competence protein ComEC family protein [Roseburia sp.]MCM1461599.1 competence protein ComEC family protein [Bacteroides sp.]
MSERIGGRIGFVYLLGFFCASFFETLPCLLAGAFLLSIGAILFLFKRRGSLFFVAALGAAALMFGLYRSTVIDPQRALIGGSALVTGTVRDCSYPDNDTVLLTVEGEAEGVSVRLSLYTPDFGAKVGDTVSFRAVFTDFRESADFSESDYSFSKGIFLKARAADEPTILSRGGFSLLRLPGEFSAYLRERIATLIRGDAGGLIRAMFFGDRSGLSPSLSVSLKRAGLSHMTAVSGMHLSLMIHTAAIAIGLISKRRIYLRFALTAALIVALMLFFGFSASVLRSGGMLLLYYGAEPLRRRTSVTHTLGAAVFAILLVSPYACRDLGLWLSVLGTFGTGAVAPRMCRVLIRTERFRKLKESLIASVCAVVCTLPVSALCFGGVSLLSPIATLAVYPLFSLILFLMLPLLLTGGLLAEALLLPAGLAARGMAAMIRFFGGLWFGYAELSDGSYPFLIALTALGAIVLYLLTKSYRRLAGFLLLSLCVLTTASVSETLANWDSIRLTVYSDGSDALLLAESRAGVSAFATSDGRRISRAVLEAAAGKNLLLICITEGEENNLHETASLAPILFHAPDSPDRVYDVSGEYTARVGEGRITLEIRGVAVELLSADDRSSADFAVISGYRKNRDPSGALNEIFCDKRYLPETEASAYYESVSLTIRSDGAVLYRHT